jgi:heme oxygenase
LEGSTLGGKFIKQMLEKSLDLPDGKGLRYFEGYGKETGLYWKNFTSALKEMPLTDNQQESLLQSANDTFEEFQLYISQVYDKH